MADALQAVLADALLALGDDELILGQRASEWCGHAPILEEDIAFANLALDEIGHAAAWYGLVAEMLGQDPDTYPDQLVFTRQPETFRCIQMVELPRGDWAFSMLRQYLFDAAENARLEAFTGSAYAPLAGLAARLAGEERYHLRHTQAWVERLSLGTQESHVRMQSALAILWPLALQIFAPAPGQALLEQAGILPPAGQIEARWRSLVAPVLERGRLLLPLQPSAIPGDGSRLVHTPHLAALLAELQSVARFEPEAAW